VTVREFLGQLQARDIWLSANGDRLRCSAPVGALTSALRDELERMKPEILAFLRVSDTTAAGLSAAVPMRAAGSKPPLFVVPGHNGDVFCFLPLLRHLAPEQPVFALEPPGLDPGQTPIATIPELARHFVDIILQTRSAGPFLIAGYCMGGVTAFEVAALLRTLGHDVPVCALIGTNCPTIYWKRYAPVTIAQNVASRLHQAVKGRSVRDIARRIVMKLVGSGPPAEAPMTQSESMERSLCLQAITEAAVRRHRPPEIDARVTLYLPGTDTYRNWKLDWERFALGGAEVVTGPAECEGAWMLREPHVGFFGAALQRTLDAALERRSFPG
jgi:thioesterase domain-containing protein